MDYRTLRNMDLNLLVVLDVLLDEASVTKASKRLGLTQSAASHALARLRSTFDDPLLVRVGTKMCPTPRAEMLRKDLRRLLSSVRRFMDDSDTFDAKTTTGKFSLRIQDSMLPLLGMVSQRVLSEAPQAELVVELANYAKIGETATNETAITIVPMSLQLPPGITRIPLGELKWSVLMRENHPAADDWNMNSWAKWSHVRVGANRSAGDYVDKKAQEEGVRRKVNTTVSHFMMALPIIQTSDLLFTSYLQCDTAFLNSYGLIQRPCPLALHSIPIGLAWSSNLDKAPARIWFFNILQSAFQSFMYQ